MQINDTTPTNGSADSEGIIIIIYYSVNNNNNHVFFFYIKLIVFMYKLLLIIIYLIRCLPFGNNMQMEVLAANLELF